MKLERLYELRNLLSEGSTDIAIEIIQQEINIEIAKSKAKKFNIFDFCAGKHEYREQFKGVYYSPDGYAVASDTNVMIVLRDETRSGEIVGRGGEVIGSEYPKFQVLLNRSYTESAPINKEWIKKIAEKKKELKAEKIKSELIVSIGNKYFRETPFSLFLSGCDEIGATEYRYDTSEKTNIIAESEKGKVLIAQVNYVDINDNIIYL